MEKEQLKNKLNIIDEEKMENLMGVEKKQKPTKNKSLLGEVWDFLKVRKAWWLAPIIIMLVIVGILIIFSQSSALSPFIYALF